eukprot:6930048-Pyramimonas_sp.AAC.1
MLDPPQGDPPEHMPSHAWLNSPSAPSKTYKTAETLRVLIANSLPLSAISYFQTCATRSGSSKPESRKQGACSKDARSTGTSYSPT